MMRLIRDADSVELKLTIREDAQRSAIRALQLDPLDAQIRQVFFFDTPDLTLQEPGSWCAPAVSSARARTRP